MPSAAYLRSPYEQMQGWMHLPRYIDKLRLHLAGRLDPEYAPFLGKNTDGLWLKAAEVTHDQMLSVVQDSLTDGQVCEWVRQHIHKSDADKHAFNHFLVNRPDPHDREQMELFAQRKAFYQVSDRADVTRFLDLIEVDEGRM
jgi:uncharacterized protein DUF5069